MHVLYVDDDDLIRELAEMALRLDPEMDVRVADGGHAALALLTGGEWRPEVLLIDVMMPQMDGPELLEEVRRLPGCSEVPIIFLTARSSPEDRNALLARGAVGVLAKPFDPMKLAAQVRAVLGSG